MWLEIAASHSGPNNSSSSWKPPEVKPVGDMEQIGLGFKLVLTFLDTVMGLLTRVYSETVFELPALDPGLRPVFDFIKALWTTSTLDAQLFMAFFKGSGWLLSEK